MTRSCYQKLNCTSKGCLCQSPIVKVPKKRDWLIDQITHVSREYQKHTIGEGKTKLVSEILTKKLENFNDQDL